MNYPPEIQEFLERLGQVEKISKDDILAQRDFIHSLFGLAAL